MQTGLDSDAAFMRAVPTMYQTLTFSRPDKAAEPMARQHTTVQPIIPPHQVHILVVDDEEPLRNLLQISLQRQGYRVVTAPNGIEAIQVLQEQKVDLVLLDVMMPEMLSLIHI